MIWFLVFFDTVGLLAGLWWIRRSGSGPSSRAILGLLALSLPLALFGLVAKSFVDRSGFAGLRVLTHLFFCVMAPLLAVSGVQHLLVRRQLFRGFSLVIFGLALDGVCYYAHSVEPFQLEITHHTIHNARIREPCKIVVVADLQTDSIGSYEEQVFACIDAQQADLILWPGDFLQIEDEGVFETEQAKFVALFSSLEHVPRLGMYAVLGDTDSRNGKVLERTPLLVPGRPPVQLSPDLQLLGHHYGQGRERIRAAILHRIHSFAGLTLIMAHSPDFAWPWVEGRDKPPATLSIAGHTHGGQICIPFFGPPLTLSRLPRHYASGLHPLGEGWLLVSRGVGMERGSAPRIRLLCPPEILVVDLKPCSSTRAQQ
jgi:hypothetical protein